MADDARPAAGTGTPLAAASASQLTGPRAGLVLTTLLLVNVFNFMDRQLPFILAESIKRDLLLSDTQLALLTGLAFLLIYSIAALPLARLADRWSPKWTLAIVVGLWSVMTALGGAARSFGQLALTRTGVALGEAGSTPASHAVIQRVFPANRRGLALGIFQMGTPAGAMIGMALGGWLNDTVGWRATMIGAGLLGLVVVALAIVVVPDVRVDAKPDAPGESFAAGVRTLMRSPAYVWMFVAMCLVGASVYPFVIFSTPFMIRVHGFSTTQAGLALGILQGLLGIVGTIVGGLVFDRNMGGKRNRLLFWPAIAFFVASPLTLLGWLVPDPLWAIILLGPFGLAMTFYFPAMFGSAHIIAGPTRHAMATSLLIVGSGLIGGLTGPVIVGFISDQLTPTLGPAALRYAIIFVPIGGMITGLAFYRANSLLTAEFNVEGHAGV